MKRPDRRRDIRWPQAWLEQAQSDLNLAKVARNLEDVLPEQAAFHAQQCVEKAIKAVLISRNTYFPPTHDIQALVDICQNAAIQFPDEASESADLTPYAVGGRYLELEEPLSESDLEHGIELATKVLAWAKSMVSEGPG